MEYEADQRLNKGGYIIHHTNIGEREDMERWGGRERGGVHVGSRGINDT